MKELELDLNKRTLTSAGIKDYYWPIKLNHVKLIRSRVYNLLDELLQDAKQHNADLENIFTVIVASLTNTLLEMVHACFLRKQCEHDGYKLLVTKHNHWLALLQDGKDTETLPMIAQLKNGPAPLSRWRFPLRFTRDILKGFTEGIPRRRLFGVRFNGDVVTLSSHRLVKMWKHQSQERVTFMRANYWFKPLKNIDVSLNTTEQGFIDKSIGKIETFFSSFDMIMPEIFRSKLDIFLNEGFLYIKQHLKNARLNNKIPMKLWIHTGGNIWARLLSVLVREKKGQITGFDHAGGSGFTIDLNHYRFRELLVSDRFIAYSNDQASLLQKNCLQYRYLFSNMPELRSLTDYKTSSYKPSSTSKVNETNQIKTIMYISTIYPDERVGIHCHFMSNLMLFDWQLRLLSHLKEMGYRVLLKPHPESLVQPPKQIEALLDITIVEGFYESVACQADLVLFDTLCSTTFYESVKLGKPIVFVQFGLTDLQPEAEKLLSKRCSIVSGYFTEKNEAMVSWNELKEAIESASEKLAPNFEKQYYLV